jgi:hypothetical protein
MDIGNDFAKDVFLPLSKQNLCRESVDRDTLNLKHIY